MKMVQGFIFAFAIAAASVANADIIGTYVDATESNTAAVAGGTWNNLPGGLVDTDDLWGYLVGSTTDAPDTMEGGGLWAADSSENPPQLVTTITGLTPGQLYDISVLYVGRSDTPWHIEAGLASDSVSVFTMNDGISVETGAVGGGGDILRQLQAALGAIVADQDGEIEVFVDRNSETSDRTWYDGVAYQAAEVPEPSSALLLACGAIGLVLMRRRR